ncbi:ABC transporter permease subunit [Tissierella praeacuta]|uniref:ABC transporter permease n=1 Tax=Tissierella praeacuta TaxID=43131 RepID=UPI0033427DFF
MKDKTKLRYKIIIGLFLSFLLLPLAIIFIWSFAKNWPWPKIFPENFGLRGWLYFLNPSSNSILVLLFSMFLSFVVTVITLIITIPAAKALALYKFKGKKLVELLIFAPIIVPTVTVAMGIHLQFIKMGLANTFLGVVMIHLIPCIPYSTRILKSVFEIIGEDMELQAKVLGANAFQVFYHITFPMLLPGIISAGSMVFIVSFSQYFLTFLIGGGRIITFSMLMFPYIQSGDRMMGSVYSIVFIFTTLIFLIMVEKITNKFYKDRLKEYRYV